MSWFATWLKKYADFHGRASRAEFWLFLLVSTMVARRAGS